MLFVKEAQLHIRVTKEYKAVIKALAKEKDISITELTLSALKGQPLRDYTQEKQFLQYLLGLTKELNYIGHNINQVTIAIHQINNGHKIPGHELEQFNALMQQYIESRDTLSKQFAELFFK
jgi:hypothetical protein